MLLGALDRLQTVKWYSHVKDVRIWGCGQEKSEGKGCEIDGSKK